MKDLMLGVFTDRDNAETAINTLKDNGYDAQDISIMMKDTREAKTLAEDTGADVAGGAVSGATTGGMVGAIAGLLVGIGAITIPGIGAILIGGPLAAALGLTGAAATTVSGAATGALAGGLIGALVGLGLPKEDAELYEKRINAGGILVAVPSKSRSNAEARSILENAGAEDIKSIHTN